MVNKRRSPVKILIVDDHPSVREGLALRISLDSDLEVCGEADSEDQALALALRLKAGRSCSCSPRHRSLSRSREVDPQRRTKTTVEIDANSAATIATSRSGGIDSPSANSSRMAAPVVPNN